MVIGLTGGIGCGKSTVAGFFKSHGFVVIDSDVLAHQALNEPATLEALKKRWGQDCIQKNGEADRAWIGQKVFTHSEERSFLESITHPRVVALRSQAMHDSTKSYILEIPLLFEKGLNSGLDVIICVASSEETQVTRLKSKGLKSEEALQRIKSQMPVSEKVKRANYVIWNDGSLDFLRAEVDNCVQRLRA